MSAATPGFPVQVLLPEQEIVADLHAALAKRTLDERFFYWLPESVDAWVQLCSASQYRNSSRALQLLTAAAPVIAERYRLTRCLCGVGCGEGSKDYILLKAFFDRGRRLAYVAADFSQALLERALTTAAPCARRLLGIKFDVFREVHLAALMQPESPMLFATLGNTLGAFDPRLFPRRMRSLVRVGDRVLFDGEIFAGEETLRGYDNPENRKFAFAPLAGVGIQESDGDLVFELRPGQRGTYEVCKHFTFHREVEARLGGHTYVFAAGERIEMSSSVKYDEGVLPRMVEGGGFQVEETWRSDDGGFMLLAAAPR